MRLFISFLFLLCSNLIWCQSSKDSWKVGFSYGTGNAIKNTDYTYTNSSYKVLFYKKWRTYKKIDFTFFFGPEYNHASHQLLNFYFVKPETPDYEAKRDAFMQLKTINEGVLHLGMTVQKMLTDTKTERLSKGFAFCDILALGYTLDFKYFALDVRPSFRHTSNAGLNTSNAGFNTKNIELGIVFPL
jgi:Lipid A 3-O-deacylase (PagL)